MFSAIARASISWLMRIDLLGPFSLASSKCFRNSFTDLVLLVHVYILKIDAVQQAFFTNLA